VLLCGRWRVRFLPRRRSGPGRAPPPLALALAPCPGTPGRRPVPIAYDRPVYCQYCVCCQDLASGGRLRGAGSSGRAGPQTTAPPSERRGRGRPGARHWPRRVRSKSAVELFVAATAGCQAESARAPKTEFLRLNQRKHTSHARTTTHYWHHTDQCYSLGVRWWRLGSRLQLRSSR
jgi:hypothetical protein